MNVNIEISGNAVCTLSTSVTVILEPEPLRTSITSSDSLDGLRFKGTFVVKRFKEYKISLIACVDENSCEEETIIHDTQFECGDVNNTEISQDQLCDGFPHCPNSMDELPRTCQREMSYSYWTPALTITFTVVILGYIVRIFWEKIQKREYNLYLVESDDSDREEMEMIRNANEDQFKRYVYHSEVLSFQFHNPSHNHRNLNRG